jgi:hypothetical protein
MLSRRLGRLGYLTVLCAGDGEAALAMNIAVLFDA